jgi:hypothetical protein
MAGWDTQTMLAYDAMNYGVTSAEDDLFPNGSGFEGVYLQEKPIPLTLALYAVQVAIGIASVGFLASPTLEGLIGKELLLRPIP